MKFEITSDQIKGLHNFRYDFVRNLEKLQEVLSPSLVEDIKRSLRRFDVVYRPLMNEYDSFIEKRIEHSRKLAVLNEFKSVWSKHDVDLLDKSNIPPGVLEYNGLEVNIPSNTTWMQMWKLADYLIEQSEDNHRIYIEEFIINDNGTVSLITGS